MVDDERDFYFIAFYSKNKDKLNEFHDNAKKYLETNFDIISIGDIENFDGSTYKFKVILAKDRFMHLFDIEDILQEKYYGVFFDYRVVHNTTGIIYENNEYSKILPPKRYILSKAIKMPIDGKIEYKVSDYYYAKTKEELYDMIFHLYGLIINNLKQIQEASFELVRYHLVKKDGFINSIYPLDDEIIDFLELDINKDSHPFMERAGNE